MSRSTLIEQAHREYITATMASAIAGVNPWESPYTLYQRMVGELPPKEETFEMWLGSQMEGIIIRAFTRETGLKVSRPKRVMDFFYTTEEYGFPMGALLDGITTDSSGQCVVEAKNPSIFAGSDWEGEPPLMYWFQIQHQLAVTGWARAYAAALIGKKFVYMPVERDEEIIALVTDKERDFWWNHVVPRVPPPIDGSNPTTDAIRARYAHSEPEVSVVIEDPEAQRLCQSYRAYSEAIDKMTLERREVSNRLLTVLDTAESAVIGGYKVSAKEQLRTNVDLTALREQFPLAAEACAKTSSSRPVKVTERKGT